MKAGSSYRRQLAAWAGLLRVPNLFSVPGDPVVGGVLAYGSTGIESGKGVVGAMVASLMLYAAGLIDNDWVDRQEDKRDRPNRPLCSGQITPSLAVLVRNLLWAAAFVSLFFVPVSYRGAFLVVLLALWLSTIVYNRTKGKSRFLGWMMMGACRGLSVLLGGVAFCGWHALTPILLIGVAGWWAYIVAVTAVADEECSQGVGVMRRYAPCGVGVLTAVGARGLAGVEGSVMLSPAMLLLAVYAFWHGGLLNRKSSPQAIQSSVGSLIKALIWAQALVCMSLPGGAYGAMVLLAAFLVSSVLGRRVYAS